ncbi:unnamed protein product [Lota lota]
MQSDKTRLWKRLFPIKRATLGDANTQHRQSPTVIALISGGDEISDAYRSEIGRPVTRRGLDNLELSQESSGREWKRGVDLRKNAARLDPITRRDSPVDTVGFLRFRDTIMFETHSPLWEEAAAAHQDQNLRPNEAPDPHGHGLLPRPP